MQKSCTIKVMLMEIETKCKLLLKLSCRRVSYDRKPTSFYRNNVTGSNNSKTRTLKTVFSTCKMTC